MLLPSVAASAGRPLGDVNEERLIFDIAFYTIVPLLERLYACARSSSSDLRSL